MKRIRQITLLAAITLVMASCATRKSAINDLRSLSNDIELNGSRYTLKEWKEAATDYAKINKQLTKHAGEYTQEERTEITELNAKCVKSFTSGAITQGTSRIENAVGFLKDIISGVKDSFWK